MVALTFEVDGQKYGLDVMQIIEVLPAVPLRRLPRVPEYVAGVFRYRGVTVPVIDLSRLIGGKPAAELLSTRIVLVRHPGPTGVGRALGLLAARATNIEEDSSEIGSSGFATPEAPFLEGLSTAGPMIQYVSVEHLLPNDLRERLFSGE
jgi:chemotaxis-related protein WspB